MKRKPVGKIIVNILVILLCCVWLVPVYMVIVNAFKSRAELYENIFAFPKHFTLEYFQGALKKMDFLMAFKNSIIVTVIAVGIIVLLSAMTAWMFVRSNNKLSKFRRTTVAQKYYAVKSGYIPGIYKSWDDCKKQTDGFSSSAQYIPFSYREYDYLSTAQLRPEYKDGQVWVNGKAVPYQEKYSYTPVSVPVNTLHRKKHGIEMVADLGTFSPLRTSLIVDGIWLYVREKNTALNGIWPIQYTRSEEHTSELQSLV